MARSGNKRHSGTTRKPVSIEHEPVKKTVPEAEPLGMDAIPDAKSAQAAPIEAKATPDKPVDEKKVDKITAPKATADKAGIHSSSKTPFNTPEKERRSGFSAALMGGIFGGILALGAGAGLQWAGVLPSLSDSFGLGGGSGGFRDAAIAMEKDLSVLKREVSQLTSRAIPEENADAFAPEEINRLMETAKTADIKADAAQKSAARAERQAASLTNALKNAENEVNALKSVMAQIIKQGGAIQDNAAAHAMSARLDEVDRRIANMSQMFADLKVLGAQFEMLKGDVHLLNETRVRVEANASAIKRDQTEIADLRDRVAAIPEPKAALANNLAPLIAANALKAAVDRGGSYLAELRTFAAIAPQTLSLVPLQDFAATGLPNGAELSVRFARIADDIAATEHKTDENAGMGQKLWGATRSLFSSRPIGEVEGINAGAIAARMEVAIKKGDFDRALNEWNALPAEAKAVSADFVKMLMARNDADKLLIQLITASLTPMEEPAATTGSATEGFEGTQAGNADKADNADNAEGVAEPQTAKDASPTEAPKQDRPDNNTIGNNSVENTGTTENSSTQDNAAGTGTSIDEGRANTDVTGKESE